jgi:hypothetical protein
VECASIEDDLGKVPDEKMMAYNLVLLLLLLSLPSFAYYHTLTDHSKQLS